MVELDKDKAVELLNRILEQELAGVVRYTHYSLLVFGYNRIPIVANNSVRGDRRHLRFLEWSGPARLGAGPRN